MADLNNMSFTGRLTRDPDLRETGSGKSVANFRVAVNGFKDDDATFLDVAAWGALGESCAKYLGKGSRVAVSGRLSTREYDRKDGTEWLAVEVSARDVAFLDTKAESQSRQSQTPAQGDFQQAEPRTPADDDIPF
jgi:single-strand DNA-binding protein